MNRNFSVRSDAMSPRRSGPQADQTRHTIAAVGANLAAVAGLDSLSLSGVAAEAGISKSGVARHFPSKERLQLAILHQAVRIYRRSVVLPAARSRPGIERLKALAKHWIGYLERETFPGGCFFTSVTIEFDARPGSVHDEIAMINETWRTYLTEQIKIAIADGELPESTPEQLIFEMTGLMLGLNHALQWQRDRSALRLTRTAFCRLLGVESLS